VTARSRHQPASCSTNWGARRPDQDLSDALTDLRETDQIPWHWIVDETRSVEALLGLDDRRGHLLGWHRLSWHQAILFDDRDRRTAQQDTSARSLGSSGAMQTARYINVVVWFYLLVSGFLDPVIVPRGGDFWIMKTDQALSLTREMWNGPAMLGRAGMILILWFIADTIIRRVHERRSRPAD
jgi:hypothetical protein